MIAITSTIKDGSMKHKDGSFHKNINNFLSKNIISTQNLITMSQTHSSNIQFVSKFHKGKRLKNCDALITKDKNIALATVTADCLPLVLYDTKKNILAVVHAGYKGILSGIIEKTIEKMKKEGASVKNIKLFTGPAIDNCCYDISQERRIMFENRFDDINFALKKEKAKTFLSLKKIASQIALQKGLPAKNIKISAVCTKCSNDHFSYRQNPKNSGLNITIAVM